MKFKDSELKEHWYDSKSILEEYSSSFIEITPTLAIFPEDAEQFDWVINHLYLPHSKFIVSGGLIFSDIENAISIAQDLTDYLLSNFSELDRKNVFLLGHKESQLITERELELIDMPVEDDKKFENYVLWQLTRAIDKCEIFTYTNNELNQDGICDLDIEVNYNILFVYTAPSEAKQFGWQDAKLLSGYDFEFQTILTALEAAYEEGYL